VTHQEEIKMLMHNYGVKQTWLAKKLGIKKQTLLYILSGSQKIDDNFYERIKELINEFQFELHLYDDEKNDSPDLFEDDKLHFGIGERIRIFAKRRYKTLKELAEAMEISPQQLQQYISGKREPGSKILIKLMRLGCDINWLLGGSESVESYKLYKLEAELSAVKETLQKMKKLIENLDV